MGGKGNGERRGVLGKLKFMVKKLQVAPPGTKDKVTAAPTDDREESTWKNPPEEVPLGLHPVYVGKSRRRYLISSRLVDHPLVRHLLQLSGGGGDDSPAAVVGCEVVLFDHLLWMIENADPQTESLDELIEFYAI